MIPDGPDLDHQAGLYTFQNVLSFMEAYGPTYDDDPSRDWGSIKGASTLTEWNGSYILRLTQNALSKATLLHPDPADDPDPPTPVFI